MTGQQRAITQTDVLIADAVFAVLSLAYAESAAVIRVSHGEQRPAIEHVPSIVVADAYGAHQPHSPDGRTAGSVRISEFSEEGLVARFDLGADHLTDRIGRVQAEWTAPVLGEWEMRLKGSKIPPREFFWGFSRTGVNRLVNVELRHLPEYRAAHPNYFYPRTDTDERLAA